MAGRDETLRQSATHVRFINPLISSRSNYDSCSTLIYTETESIPSWAKDFRQLEFLYVAHRNCKERSGPLGHWKLEIVDTSKAKAASGI